MATPRVKNAGAVRSRATVIQTPESTIDPVPAPAEPLRILALDGGPSALLVVLMLTDLEKLAPGFLEKVDVIAGTSAGAITGLMLSTKPNPAHMLPVAENFWLNEQNYYKNSAFGYLKALTGLGAVNDPQYVQQFLEQKGVLASRTLADLAKKVVVTTFEVNPVRQAPGMRGPLNWQPKVFHNLTTDAPDLDVLAVDAALSSSASPVTTPIHQGRVDGGLAANNPAMLGLAQVLRSAVVRDRHDVVMLSIGGGRAHESLKVTDNSWGYVQWLLNPKNPLLLLNGFLTGSSEAIAFETAEILDKQKFCRLDPFFTEPGLLPFVQASPKKQQETAASAPTQLMLQSTAHWLRASGWLPESEPAQPAQMAAGA